MTRRVDNHTAPAVRIIAVLCALLFLHTTFSLSAVAWTEEEPSTVPAQTTEASAPPASSPEHQTSMLNRLWWRNLEEQDTFIQSLFSKPLAMANIGVVTSATGGESAVSGSNNHNRNRPQHEPQQQQQQQNARGKASKSREVAHHAPANSTEPEKRLFIPKLHLVYTITSDRKRALEAEAAEASTQASSSRVQPPPTAATVTSYTQLLRSVLPLSFGSSTEDAEEPLTPLQVAALASPIAPLRAYVVNEKRDVDARAAQRPAGEEDEVAGDATKQKMHAGTAARAVEELADQTDSLSSSSTPHDTSSPQALTPSSADAKASLYKAQNSADETLVVVASTTKAVVPLRIVGTSYTVVQFDGKAGNTINAVVQLKDHRYNTSVSTRNCYNMYLKVELRNHVKTGKSSEGTNALSSAQASTQPHPYIHKNQWNSRPAEAAQVGDDGSTADPDISTSNRGSWANFWDSFALMFDTSALCKVLPSVSMRVSRAPQTEPFYVVLRSTTGYAYETAYYYNTTSGAFYANTMDDDYVCDLDLFIEQWPAAEQERMQLIFSFIVPLLVLLLPLPLTMRRADLVQQYMMETDYAEWVWRPPYYLRSKIIEALRALGRWGTRVRNAYRQQALQTQLLRQQQQQEQQQPEGFYAPAQPSRYPTSTENTNADRSSKQKVRGENEGSSSAPAFATSATPIPSDAAARAVSADPSRAAEREDTASSTPHCCTPRSQFKASPSAPSSQASDSSQFEQLSTGSASGSDFDERLDGPCRRDAHHHHHHHHRSHSCDERGGGGGGHVHPGAVSPPQKVCAPDTLLYPGGVAAPSLTGQGGGQPLSTSPTEPNSKSNSQSNSSNNRRSQRCRHRCQHYSSGEDGAARAVSVHVPFSMESPVVQHPRASAQHRSAHDLLFTSAETTEEAEVRRMAPVSNAALPARTPREEAEAQSLSPPPVDGALPLSSSISADAAAATTAPKTSKEGAAAASAPTSDDTDGEEAFCRICREGNDVAPLITPCGCTGSVRFVHAACLDRWRLESAKRNLANVNNCEICKLPFTVTIQRSTLVWESTQHVLRSLCLIFTFFVVVALTTTLTHGILGELSCVASYHEVAYGTMFRFEGLSLSLFVYGLAVLLVLFANLIVYSWFRSRPEVEEYVEEMHTIPPFYTPHNKLLILLVSVLLLAQVFAMGCLLKYFLYNTSQLVWSWEASPLVGGMLFALFTTCSITVCSWGRQMYMTHIVNRGSGAYPAEDVVVEEIGNAAGRAAAPLAGDAAAAAAPDRTFVIPTSTTLNYVNASSSTPAPETEQNAASPVSPGSASVSLVRGERSSAADDDTSYTRHFEVPAAQRVIRAYEYCPPHRKLPK